MEAFATLLSDLNSVSSKKAKEEMLRNYTGHKEPVLYAMDPYRQYNVTSKLVVVNVGDRYTNWHKLQMLLDRLCKRELTGNAAIAAIQDAMDGARQSDWDAFLKILDKNLRAGIGVPTVNKVWPKYIPTFDVQLCDKYEDLEVLPFKDTYASRKLDGCRCLIFKDGQDVTFISRQGKAFETLKNLVQPVLKAIKAKRVVLDGEICIMNPETGIDDFSAVMKEIKRKDHQIANPKFKVFDMITHKNFLEKKSNDPFFSRFLAMKDLIVQNEYIEVLEQLCMQEPEQLQEMLDKGVKEGWEGLILRDAQAPYIGKRSKSMLKVKKFHEHEFKIVDFQEGEGNVKGMLGALIVEGEYEGEQVRSKVGSGFTQKWHKDEDTLEVDLSRPVETDERYKFWRQKDELLGQVVTVKFFEMTKNQKGDHSLRFPVFRHLHGDERSV